ncbi:MAG TPA: serine/threonine-protein kinase [Polyangiaceae bacterium]|jgi:serine/threonine protein kinase
MESDTRLGGGRYVVKGLLGEGSQGATYEATDEQTGRSVAIKRFDVRGAKRWKDVELAEREARVLATLDHPLVPRYLEHFEEDGALYLVMEKVEGETLDAIRRREGSLPEAEVRRFLACADRALTYLHGRGAPIVHRDIKPTNVVRRPDGSYVLVDFGAVSEVLFRRGASTVVGTMGYMAPEQIQGRSLPASDVYAVGATALAALTGAEPETLPHKGLRVEVRTVVGGRASPELVASLERMLEPDPDLRAASVAAALDTRTVRVPAAPLPAERPARSSEDAVVRSLRGLIWALWGLGWVLVPIVLGKVLDMPEGIPIVMFGWLALNLIVGWHKGAVLRMLVRRWNAETASADVARALVAVEEPRAQVRVGMGARLPDEAAGTDADAPVEEARQRSAR